MQCGRCITLLWNRFDSYPSEEAVTDDCCGNCTGPTAEATAKDSGSIFFLQAAVQNKAKQEVKRTAMDDWHTITKSIPPIKERKEDIDCELWMMNG